MSDLMDTFTRLSPCLYVHFPSSTAPVLSPTHPLPPTTILFFAWMGALPRHFSKFLTHYITTYPAARIAVVITGKSDVLHRSYATQSQRLEPLLQLLLADASARSDGGVRLLVHAFSNGGSLALINLLVAFQQRTGAPMPIRAVILDSAPGRARLKQSSQAMRLSMPQQAYLQLPIWVFVSTLVGVLWVIHRVFRWENVVDRVRRMLNDPRVSPPEAKRCYMYSKSDNLVSWVDVEEHADDAERRGYDVTRNEFDGSAHVCHMRLHQAQYWSALERVWESAVQDLSKA